ncbi:acyl-CoA thioesterase/bile acid-CoA:amino acid N-acyltransferase family protein [Kitasatospora cineracea]|uniref:Dienelactone hydrolase n=1 Tax=Kitasatospora cineracea TaxID=88074 RepID=A0A8G1ULP3_9ACTN|nr:acyl-CoA thioesterase/bile acid-CoA:amino acid N-acyltransferase family protein [Kitasatospora cineracea]ROR46153.1 dienelactone hydrolase [Kitasatospora cineracea]
MGERIRRVACAAAALALVGAGAAGCSADQGGPAAIEVDAPTALVDQPVHVRITGLRPGQEVTVDSRAADRQGLDWNGRADFRADAHGAVALDTAAPRSGTYQGADGMGLFWSMEPRDGDPETAFFFPPTSAGHTFDVTLTATAHGRPPVSRTLTRAWSGPGVTSRQLTLAADRVSGELFLPAPGTPRHPAVLLFGGSEGGNGETSTAALLASHGYPALALGYFGLPGLPATLEDIPLEYFATAAGLLAAQPGTDPDHLLALGYSRGSEAALLLADDYPGLVHGAIVYSPSAQVNGGFPDHGSTAWTKDGKDVGLGPIPLDQVSGPVLAIAGADDHLWSSPLWARQIAQELDTDHDPHPHRALVLPDAGHGVGTYPYLAAGTRPTHPVTGRPTDLGGTRAGNAAAKAKGWPEVLSLLAGLTA